MLPNSISKLFSNTVAAVKHKKYRHSLVEKIEQQIEPSLPYFTLLACASVIAVLGLITNNVIIVIGAMIIAPIYWPMVGIAMGITAANYKILKRSVLMTSASIGTGLLISFTIASFIPSNGTNQLIELTSSSNILHLVVAAASTLGGIIAIYYPLASVSIVGSAVSLSLIPPLAAAGLGLAQGSSQIFFGAGRLLAANTIVIIFVGTLSFYAFRIRSGAKNRSHFWLGLAAVGIFLIMLAIPLNSSLRQKQAVFQEKEIIQQEIEQTLTEKYPEVELFELDLSLLSDQASAWRARVILLVPETSLLDKDNLDLVEKGIEKNSSSIILFEWHKIKAESF